MWQPELLPVSVVHHSWPETIKLQGTGEPIIDKERASSGSVADISLPVIVPITQLHNLRRILAILGRRKEL